MWLETESRSWFNVTVERYVNPHLRYKGCYLCCRAATPATGTHLLMSTRTKRCALLSGWRWRTRMASILTRSGNSERPTCVLPTTRGAAERAGVGCIEGAFNVTNRLAAGDR